MLSENMNTTSRQESAVKQGLHRLLEWPATWVFIAAAAVIAGQATVISHV
jgi:hypothetical protein